MLPISTFDIAWRKLTVMHGNLNGGAPMKKSPSVKAKLLSIVLLFAALALLPINGSAQIAVGKSKFLGNIINGNPPSNFSTYWNQVTPENAGKWGSVEPTRDVMNWGQLDTIYNYA